MTTAAKDKKKIYVKGYSKKEREKVCDTFAKWFSTQGNRVVSHQEIADFIHERLPNNEINAANIANYIGQARRFMEKNYGKTIWNIRGEGWRIAKEPEKAIFLVRSTRNVLKHADRAKDLHDITDKKYLAEAQEYVFGSSARAQKAIAHYSERYKALFSGGGQTIKAITSGK